MKEQRGKEQIPNPAPAQKQASPDVYSSLETSHFRAGVYTPALKWGFRLYNTGQTGKYVNYNVNLHYTLFATVWNMTFCIVGSTN